MSVNKIIVCNKIEFYYKIFTSDNYSDNRYKKIIDIISSQTQTFIFNQLTNPCEKPNKSCEYNTFINHLP